MKQGYISLRCCISVMLFLGILCVGVSTFAFGLIPPPAGISDDALILQSPANVQHEFATQAQFGGLSIVLEETLLTSVQEHLGLGRIAHRGDAGDSLTWLCYTAIAGAQIQRIWISHDELHGGGEISAVAAEIAQNASSNESCPTLPKSTLISVGKDIRLGLSVADIEERVGVRAKRAGPYYAFTYAGLELLSNEDKQILRRDPYDVQNVLVIEAREGRAIRLWVWKATTN